MIEFLIALLIVGIPTVIFVTAVLTIEHFRDKRVAKRMWEEYMSERGGKQ